MKADHPALPMSAAEMAVEARACLAAGASVLHLHVRDGRDGGHSLDPALYRQSMAAVQAELGDDLILQVTTEAVGIYSADYQMSMVRDLQPEAVTLAYRELFMPGFDEQQTGDFLNWMAGAGVWPQFIIYDHVDLAGFIGLHQRGFIPFPAPFVMFVLGQYGRREAVPEDLSRFLEVLGQWDWPWSICAFGRREADCVQGAIAAGGHVRVGFENNLWLPDGSVAPGNAALVAVAAKAAAAAGRGVMSAADVRAFIRR